MKQQFLSAALVLCLCTSSLPAAHISQEVLSPKKDVLTEESTSRLIACDSTVPAPQEAYEAMIALKDQDAYMEGTTWTDYEPYSDAKGYYRWKGGQLNGANIVAVGCVAFAFILSDTAFGNLPARMYAAGNFSFEDIKVGDILRVNNDAHTVIVLEVSDAGVIVAEGNLSGKVHWGRAMSKDEVMRNTSHYITRYPEGYIAPNDPTANETVDGGTLTTGLTWNLTKAGTLTISGSGAMPADFSGSSDQPWSKYSSQIRKIIIKDGVTDIGSSAFYGNEALSVEIPDSVTAIGNNAFRECSLIYASIPSGVKTIGDDAFRQCENLTSVTVSEGVETIGQRAFRGCVKLASADLPASIQEMGAGAFYDCTELLSVTFASGGDQVKMGEDLFARCWRLYDVKLPENLDCISDRMFQNCYLALYSVRIPQGAVRIGDSAFSSCSALSALTIPDSVQDIEMNAFLGCNSLTDIYYTGTEAQWGDIYKAPNVIQALANVTIHYEYNPDIDDGDDNDNNNPTPTPAPTDKPDSTPAPTDKPDSTPAPTDKPDSTPAPTDKPDSTPAPTDKPDSTPAPTEKPDSTPVPTAEPSAEPPVEESPAPRPGEGLVLVDGNYYFYEDGEMATSKEAVVNGEWRWFDEDGTMAVDKDVYHAGNADNGGKWVRYNENGEMVKGEDYRYGGWYYFESVTGAMAKGPAVLEDGRQVYYDTITGQMLKGEQNINGQNYIFDEVDGHLLQGNNTKIWVQIDGKDFWYEDWERQGYDSADVSYRGKEIYDPASGAWYWLDSVQHGAKAVSKDVYQESYSAYPDREDGTGKWVRYDENGRMVKGWDTTEAGTYYFEEVTGAMAKGHVIIDGREYYFDPITGIRQD